MTNQASKEKAQAEIRETMAGEWASEPMREGVAQALDRLWPGWRDAEAREFVRGTK